MLKKFLSILLFFCFQFLNCSYLNHAQLSQENTQGMEDAFLDEEVAEAVRNNDFEFVKLFLIKNPNQINLKTDHNYTLLGIALVHSQHLDNSDIIKHLININSDLNSFCDGQSTPLHFAVNYSNVELVKLLLDANAKIDNKDIFGCTVIDSAKKNYEFYINIDENNALKALEVINLLNKHRLFLASIESPAFKEVLSNWKIPKELQGIIIGYCK